MDTYADLSADDMLGQLAAELAAHVPAGPCMVVGLVEPAGADALPVVVPAGLIDRGLREVAAVTARCGWPADGYLLVHLIDMAAGLDHGEALRRHIAAVGAAAAAWPAARLAHVAVVDRSTGTWSSLADPTLRPLPPAAADQADPLAAPPAPVDRRNR